MCDSSIDYTVGGYPVRPKDKTGRMEPWKTPFLLLIDRGECTFVHKARNAQKAGAAGVLIADNSCLCDHGDDCTSDPGEYCEDHEPIMADDGSGSDITIPSFLVFKQEADPIKAALKNNTFVRMEMTWSLPRPDSRVEYNLWSTPKDDATQAMKLVWRDFALALADHAQFTPHYYFYDGAHAGCYNPNSETSMCYNFCTNQGRYCAMDPDDDADWGASGADIVTESLRRLCIWDLYGKKDGIGEAFWDYVIEFHSRCDYIVNQNKDYSYFEFEDDDDDTDANANANPNLDPTPAPTAQEIFFNNGDCLRDAMKHSGIEPWRVKKCMNDAGGLEEGVNTILDNELELREQSGAVIMPAFFVNNAPVRGMLTPSEVFEAICAGYAQHTMPTICEKCRHCEDAVTCIHRGHCPGAAGSGDILSMPVFAGSLLVVIVVFTCVGCIAYQRQQIRMRHEVEGILAQYAPLDKVRATQSVGIAGGGDYDDEGHIELS